MTRATAALIASLLAGACLTTTASPIAAQDPTQKKTFAAPHVFEALDQAITQPMPAGLSAADQKGYVAHTEWLKSVRDRIKLAISHEIKAPRDLATGQASGRQAGPAPKDWDALKATIETEARQFNTLSNASKARHEMAMSAIRNLKA